MPSMLTEIFSRRQRCVLCIHDDVCWLVLYFGSPQLCRATGLNASNDRLVVGGRCQYLRDVHRDALDIFCSLSGAACYCRKRDGYQYLTPQDG